MVMEETALSEPANFTAEVTDADDATIVSLAGEIDISSAGALREVLVLPEVLQAPWVRLDLTKVEFLDSPGIGMIVSACKRVRALGGAFSVTCGEGKVRHILEVAGLLEYLHVEDQG